MSFVVSKFLCSALIVFLSCSQPDKTRANNNEVNNIKRTFYLRSAIKAAEVSKNYIYCDSTVKGDLSCFIEYNGKRYLKREKLSFDSRGNLKTALLYKPEGNISYQQKDLLADTLLVETSGWTMNNNVIETNGTNIMKPVSGIMIEMNEIQKVIYFLSEPSEGGKQFFYVYEYW